MPQEGSIGKVGAGKKRGGLPRVRSHTDAELQYYRDHDTILPSQFK